MELVGAAVEEGLLGFDIWKPHCEVPLFPLQLQSAAINGVFSIKNPAITVCCLTFLQRGGNDVSN
jgi:hypothetical protein